MTENTANVGKAMEQHTLAADSIHYRAQVAS